MLRISDDITLLDWELSESFTRSSGPGGQHVNKVSSAVELRFEAARSPHLSPAIKSRLKKIAGRKWAQDGAITIRVEQTRSQARNREIARESLVEMVKKAMVAPKRRVATRPTLASKRRRLEAKEQRGQLKSLRRSVSDE